MEAESPLESRLTAIESRVVALECKLGARKHSKNWVSRFMGAFRKYPEFGEVLEEGRRLANAEPADADEDAA